MSSMCGNWLSQCLIFGKHSETINLLLLARRSLLDLIPYKGSYVHCTVGTFVDEYSGMIVKQRKSLMFFRWDKYSLCEGWQHFAGEEPTINLPFLLVFRNCYDVKYWHRLL